MDKNQEHPEKLDGLRRKLLLWTPPAIAVVALPAHAQTSMCGSSPTLVASVASKCSGEPPVGQAILTLASDGADPADAVLQISAFTVTGVGDTDMFAVPSLPASVSDTAPIDIEWMGQATDAVTCLPLADITIEVTYTCQGAVSDMTATFDLTEVLSDAIP